MLLDKKEIGRLAIMIKFPNLYVERRVEEIDLLGDNYYRVRVSQQVLFPSHADRLQAPKDDVATARQLLDHERLMLVPLGEYAKHRLPDLKVFGPSGESLPVLSRADRARALSTIFTAGWLMLSLRR